MLHLDICPQPTKKSHFQQALAGRAILAKIFRSDDAFIDTLVESNHSLLPIGVSNDWH